MSKEKISAKKVDANVESNFVFGKQNYLIMIVGVLVITAGFILMAGSEDIFNFQKLTLAPILVLLGFVIEIYAIMKK
jgi:uncharacterized membrane protein